MQRSSSVRETTKQEGKESTNNESRGALPHEITQGDDLCALFYSQPNLAGKPSQLISGSLLGILGLGRQFVRARAVWSQVNQPWRLEHYWYLETQHVLGKLALRRSCWCAGGWNTSNARGASRLPSRPTHAAAARRLTDLYLKRCGFVTAAPAEKMWFRK